MSAPMEFDTQLLDLAVKKALEGLTVEEQIELDSGPVELQVELLRFEQAAAALTLAARQPLLALPELTRARLLQNADHFIAEQARARQPEPRSSERAGGKLGWLAAAACLVLAVFLWARSPGESPARSTAELRTALLARADSQKLPWQATADPGGAGVSGDLVWNPVTQQGFMRIVGMQTNDPAAHQYQLWIFDAQRDERYPIDGGVFNVPAGMPEVVVPIHAALPVGHAKLFAVTLEKPGGVVVSAREHILITAQPG